MHISNICSNNFISIYCMEFLNLCKEWKNVKEEEMNGQVMSVTFSLLDVVGKKSWEIFFCAVF
jgi:hypothetical protein